MSPDPKIVREIARTAGLMIIESVARDHIVHAAMAQHGIGHDNVYAWSETYDRVLDELAAVLKPLTQPDEQQPADVVTAEQQQDGAAGRVLAYLDDHRARYPYDATGVIADLHAAYDNGLLPLHELREDDLRAVLAERTALAARVAELESEREADTRVVAAVLNAQADGASMAECKHAFTELRARFADRITALDVTEPEES